MACIDIATQTLAGKQCIVLSVCTHCTLNTCQFSVLSNYYVELNVSHIIYGILKCLAVACTADVLETHFQAEVAADSECFGAIK